ncbi:zinc finger ZPR1, partial, partial [Paramuricea clavata]
MKAVDIPFFKQVILMAINCSNCGKRSSEVKSGAGIEDQGKRIELKIIDPTDLSRDVLKADTCTFKIPELDFELQSGTLGGRFTTLEGLLVNVKESLEGQHPFGSGDAPSLQEDDNKMKTFITKLVEHITNSDDVELTISISGNLVLGDCLVHLPDITNNMLVVLLTDRYYPERPKAREITGVGVADFRKM